MALVRGPFEAKYGVNVLADIEEVNLTYDIETNDHSSLQGRTFEVQGAHKVTLEVPFLESDVPSLAAVLPQHFVANGGTLSTGEVVNNAEGAIDVVPTQCAEDADTTDFILTSCNGHVLRIVDVISEFGGVEIDGNVRKVTVRFTGASSAGTIQMFKEGAVSIVS